MPGGKGALWHKADVTVIMQLVAERSTNHSGDKVTAFEHEFIRAWNFDKVFLNDFDAIRKSGLIDR